jgi:peptidoglycan-N-acetylglucosamine deacetylase
MTLRKALLGGAIAAPILAAAVAFHSWPVAILILFSSHMLLLYPTLVPRSQWWGRVITRFQTEQPEVWLTIDDGPDENDTPALLGLLESHGANATFFVQGSRLLAAGNLGQNVVSAGHELGNHSHAHPSGSFWMLSRRRLEEEIKACSEAIEKVSGERPRRFRPPVGMKNFFVHPILERHGMELIGWSARGFDGLPFSSPETVVERIMKKVRPGAILLIHEGRRSRDGRSISVEVARLLLERLSATGYRCVIPESTRLS